MYCVKPARDRCAMLGLTFEILQYTRSAQRSSGQLCTLGCQPVLFNENLKSGYKMVSSTEWKYYAANDHLAMLRSAAEQLTPKRILDHQLASLVNPYLYTA